MQSTDFVRAAFDAPKAEGQSLVDRYASDLAEMSQSLRCEPRILARQFLLHAPYFERSIIESGQLLLDGSRMHDILRLRMSNYNLGVLEYIDGIAGVKKTAEPIRRSGLNKTVFFQEVPESQASLIEGRLHYMQYFRRDAAMRYGLYLKGSKYPFAYASFAPCDREYLHNAAEEALGREVNNNNMLSVCRIFAADAAPRHSVSMLLSLSLSRLSSDGYSLFVTAVNPYLQFSGGSICASSFSLFARSPVAYRYDNIGIYNPRRSRSAVARAKWVTPQNFVFMRSTSRKFIKRIAKGLPLIDIPGPQHEEGRGVDAAALGKRTLPVVLGDIRRHVEKAWGSETRYPKTPFNPQRDRLSKGQCGVSSAFLSQRLLEAGYDVQFCEGDVIFADMAPITDHCWLVLPGQASGGRVHTSDDDLVIDITADQSGFAQSVLCDTYADLRGRGIEYQERRRIPPAEIGVAHLWYRLDILKDRLSQRGEV